MRWSWKTYREDIHHQRRDEERERQERRSDSTLQISTRDAVKLKD